MAFARNHLKVLFTNWPDHDVSIWGYRLPVGDTLETIRQDGYFDEAPARLKPRSIILIEQPGEDDDDLAEVELFVVLSRKTEAKPNRVSKVRGVKPSGETP